MATSHPITDKEVEVPEWEHAAAATNNGTATRAPGTTLTQKFDSAMPPHKKYLGMRRKVFLLVLLAAFLALLALIIGLAVGLTQRSSKSANLPLPSNSETFTGDLTYYQTGLGACGVTSTSSDNIVSVSHIIFDAAGSSSSTGGNSNNNPLCGLKLHAKRFNDVRGEERSVDLTVVDRCTGCQPNDIDVSYSAFDQIASRDKGRVEVTWAWL